jgi:hypothetical protein
MARASAVHLVAARGAAIVPTIARRVVIHLAGLDRSISKPNSNARGYCNRYIRACCQHCRQKVDSPLTAGGL